MDKVLQFGEKVEGYDLPVRRRRHRQEPIDRQACVARLIAKNASDAIAQSIAAS